MFDYLEYLDEPTHENFVFVHQKFGRTIKETAKIVGVTKRAYESWLLTPDSPHSRSPSTVVWNSLLFEMQAREKGYKNLAQLVKKAEVQN